MEVDMGHCLARFSAVFLQQEIRTCIENFDGSLIDFFNDMSNRGVFLIGELFKTLGMPFGNDQAMTGHDGFMRIEGDDGIVFVELLGIDDFRVAESAVIFRELAGQCWVTVVKVKLNHSPDR